MNVRGSTLAQTVQDPDAQGRVEQFWGPGYHTPVNVSMVHSHRKRSFSSSSSESESPSPARKQCPSQDPTGCYDGCQGCKSYWHCSTCGKGYYEGCHCETPLRDERQDTQKSATAVVSSAIRMDPKSPLDFVRQEILVMNNCLRLPRWRVSDFNCRLSKDR